MKNIRLHEEAQPTRSTLNSRCGDRTGAPSAASGCGYAASIYGQAVTEPRDGLLPLWVTEASPVCNTGDKTYVPDTIGDGLGVGLDWFRWSGPAFRLVSVLRLCRQWLGLHRDEWADAKGLWFYTNRYAHPLGLNLCYTPDSANVNAEHCTLEISGTAIQALGLGPVLSLNHELHQYGFHATRVDIRSDWHGEGITLIGDLANACRAGHLAMLRSWEPKEKYGRDGRIAYGCNLGTRESPVFYRAYDKGLEQGDRPEGEWVRLELELKADRSRSFARDLSDLASSGFYGWEKKAAGVLFGHVDFLEGDKSQRMNTRTRCAFWSDLVAGIDLARYRPEKAECTLDRWTGWMRGAVCRTVQAIMDNAGVGIEEVWCMLTKDLDPLEDAMARPVVYEAVQAIRGDWAEVGHWMEREASPI